MAYMCMGCYEVYDRDLGYCPKTHCSCGVVEIDELMIPTIKILNEKGYMTEFCCSGHVHDNGCTSYVCLYDFITEIFEEEDINNIKEMLPESWEMEIDELNRIHFFHRIKKDWEDKFSVKTYEDILEANLEFLHFVQQLPELEY